MIRISCDSRFLDDYHGTYAKSPFILQMEKSEQRSVIKFLVLKGLGAKTIHKELTTVLASTAYSISQVKK
jgi:hypothetical protein